MKSLRRSTRLNTCSNRNEDPTSTSKASWRLTNNKQEENSTDTEAEDDENYDILNKMEKKSNRKIKADGAHLRGKIVEGSSISQHSKQKRKASCKNEDKCEELDRERDQGKLEASPPKLAMLTLQSPTVPKSQKKEDTKAKPIAVDNDTPKKLRSPTRSKYQNARRVLSSTETLRLPGRETELQQLRDFFKERIEKQASGSLYISGQPGTGKTACLSLLLQTREFKNSLECVYINCTSVASVGNVFKKLCAELGLRSSGRTEREHLEAIQQYLCTAGHMVLIVMDEIDQLCSAKQSVLYTIFEWPSLPGAKILLVGIANSLDLTDRALMRLNSRCELKPRLMHFPPYTKQQIVDIFKARLEEADVLDIFPPVTLQLLAAKVSAISGDVRRALDIGRRVVEIAEQKKKTGIKEFKLKDLEIDGEELKKMEEMEAPVQVSQVAVVLNKVYGASQNLEADIEEAFPLQQKIMLCSLLLMLRNERNKNITMARLYEVYRRVCMKRNLQAVDQTEFFGLVDLVETRGILRLIRKKEPRLSKVVLQWDEEEVNGALRDKQLIAAILDDTGCLGK